MKVGTSLIAIGLSGALFSSCTRDDLAPKGDQTAPSVSSFSPTHALPGVFYVYVSDRMAEELAARHDGAPMRSVQPISDDLYHALEQMDAVSISPLFAVDRRYQQRVRHAGLNRWYRVTFDPHKDLTKAYELIKDLRDISQVECAYPISVESKTSTIMERINSLYHVNSGISPLLKSAPGATTSDETPPFNDPRLEEQWYLHNTGQRNKNFVKGADINVYDAWKITTGKPNVIVAVIDEAIDYNHEDLAASMAVNQAELNGIEGKDDDGNGYVDDIYGFNFTNMTGTLTLNARGHGTHVAGIIAARNNNGIGICGIAGGDGTPDSGVRLLSCETLGPNEESGFLARAFMYAADNGAVICNNSWILPSDQEMPRYLKDAITYFINNAGCDAHGNQLPDSPMKGGLVVFASGNSALSIPVYPASYSPVVAVTGMSGSLKKANYANYGTYIDIAAFGGDPVYDGYNSDILSLFPPSVDTNGDGDPDGIKYIYKFGTSQAAPQVTGVAALIVSAKGGPGFTARELKSRLLSALRPFDINAYNADYKGLLGVGYIDAAKALKDNENKPPQSSSIRLKHIQANQATLTWEVSSDADDGTPLYYNLYYSKDQLTAQNYSSYLPVKIFVGGTAVGSLVERQVSSLIANTTYYFALEAVDRWELKSDPTFVSGYTRNTPPVAEGVPDSPIHVSVKNDAVVRLRVSDPDGHLWSYRFHALSGLSIRREGNDLLISLRASLPSEENDIMIDLVDELGGVTTVSFKAIVGPSDGSGSIGGLPEVMDIYLNDVARGIQLGDIFGYPSSTDKVRYELTNHSPRIITAQIFDQIIKVTPLTEGVAKVSVSALGKSGLKRTQTLSIRVNPSRVSGDEPLVVKGIYPNPIVRYLKIDFGDDVSAATAHVVTLNGRLVLDMPVTLAHHQGILDLQALMTGQYTLKVKTNKGTYSVIIIKQ